MTMSYSIPYSIRARVQVRGSIRQPLVSCSQVNKLREKKYLPVQYLPIAEIR